MEHIQFRSNQNSRCSTREDFLSFCAGITLIDSGVKSASLTEQRKKKDSKHAFGLIAALLP